MTPPEIVHLMREASGQSMMTCKRAWEMARDELDGDYLLAVLMLDGDSLAINVKDAPGQKKGQGRAQWNRRYAESMRQTRIDASHAYARLAEISKPKGK